MRTAYTISAIGHAAVLLWSVWSLAAKPLPVSSNEGLPIDLVTASEFSKITAGTKSAPKAETAKPLVERFSQSGGELQRSLEAASLQATERLRSENQALVNALANRTAETLAAVEGARSRLSAKRPGSHI